jgi:hypothetical protein
VDILDPKIAPPSLKSFELRFRLAGVRILYHDNAPHPSHRKKRDRVRSNRLKIAIPDVYFRPSQGSCNGCAYPDAIGAYETKFYHVFPIAYQANAQDNIVA